MLHDTMDRNMEYRSDANFDYELHCGRLENILRERNLVKRSDMLVTQLSHQVRRLRHAREGCSTARGGLGLGWILHAGISVDRQQRVGDLTR